jgi:hypothetical protein
METLDNLNYEEFEEANQPENVTASKKGGE